VGSTWNGGLVTTVPPTYINEWIISPRTGDDLSNAMIREEHWKHSSARSKRATMLSLKLTLWAVLPSTYKALGLPGSLSTTPSKVAPILRAEMVTLLAYGNASRPSRGKMVSRKSKASLECFSSPPPTASSPAPLSGVSGGVTRLCADGTLPDLPGIT